MLDPPAIDAYLNSGNKKAGELLQAYQTAKDPSEWDAAQQQKAEDHRRQMEGEDELADDEPDHQDEDELEDDGEGGAGDKRKRSSKAADKKPTSGKKAKTEKKAKVSAHTRRPPLTSTSASAPLRAIYLPVGHLLWASDDHARAGWGGWFWA